MSGGEIVLDQPVIAGGNPMEVLKAADRALKSIAAEIEPAVLKMRALAGRR